MPQLYKHEILFFFCAHESMGHKGIANVPARIKERHRRSPILRALLEKSETKNRELTQKMAEMDNALARVIAQVQAMSAATPLHEQKPVVLKSAKTKLLNDTKIEPTPAQTIGKVADAISCEQCNRR